MKTLYKKKIYQGRVELRDYELKRLLALKEPVRIYVGDEYMDLTYMQLKNQGKVTNTQTSFINKGQTYKLIGFDWKPQKDYDQPVDIYQAYAAMPDSIRREIRRKLGLPEGGEENDR